MQKSYKSNLINPYFGINFNTFAKVNCFLMLSFANSSTRSLQAFQLIRFMAMITIGIAMARLGYGNTAIGNYEAVLFVSGLLTTFWVTGLIQSLLPLYKNGISNDNRLFNAFMVISGLTALSCALALIFSNSLKGFALLESKDTFYLMLVYLLLSTPASMVEYIYLLNSKFRSMLFYGLTTYGIQIAFVLLPVFMGLDVTYAVFGLIGVSAIRFVWLVLLVVKYSKTSINVDFLKDFLGDGIPLSLKFLVSSSGLYIDQLIIGYYYDSSTFAVYRFGAREIPLITVLAVPLSNSMLVEFADRQKLKQNLERLKSESLRLMHIFFPISIVAILLARLVFPLVFGVGFTESANVFMIYCLIVISKVLFPQTIAQGFRRSMAVLAISIIEMALNIILSLLLVKYFGINGVAAATVIVFTLEKILLMAYNSYQLNIPALAYTPLKTFLVYSSVLILTFAFAWIFL